jgi:O-acetyl-ADP-ribose deacetylase (regulator of RNase III)
MATIQASEIPTLTLLYKLSKLAPSKQGVQKYPSSKALNDRVGLIRGDITCLAVDVIVNAANQSLAGGGGVDGAIHYAAGPQLLRECRTLRGCNTGSAKITGAYKLPCIHVIHAVGPIYDIFDPATSARHLTSCYNTSLGLAAANRCETIAFSGISTGVYGYPSREAAPIAIGTVRKYLEEDTEGIIKRVIFVTYEKKDAEAYNEFLP